MPAASNATSSPTWAPWTSSPPKTTWCSSAHPEPGKRIWRSGIAIRACQAGHRVLFATASPNGSTGSPTAHHAGTLQTELIRLARYPLLVIDEVGYIPFEPEAANLFFQLVSSRYERA